MLPMSPTATSMLLLAAALGLVAFGWLWLRRRPARAVAAIRPAARGRASMGPLGPGCPLDEPLLMAVDTDTASSTRQADTKPEAKQGSKPTAQPKSSGTPPKRKPSGPSRRSFLRGAWGLGWLGVIGGFSLSSLAFLWPNLRGGFGAQFPVAPVDEILANIEANQGRWEFPTGRALFVRYDASLDPDGEYAALTNDTPVMALYQVCVHLGCKVPWCASAQWWECPCHGSKYNRWGEWQDGPAPRGLDRFAVREAEGVLVLDTAAIIEGPPRTTQVLQQPPEGPHCVSI